MARVNSVTLPKDIEAVFPNECVVCGSVPDSKAGFSYGSVPSLLTFAIPFLDVLHLFHWKRIEYPICRQCERRFFIQRWGRTLLLWIPVILIMWFAYWSLGNFDPWIRRFLVVGCALVVIIPFMVFESYAPQSFDVLAHRDRTTYKFASRKVANSFYLTNRDAYPDAAIQVDLEFLIPEFLSPARLQEEYEEFGESLRDEYNES